MYILMKASAKRLAVHENALWTAAGNRSNFRKNVPKGKGCFMRKKGWILLLVLLCVAFLMSCGKNKEPDEAKGELVRSEREENLSGTLLFWF